MLPSDLLVEGHLQLNLREVHNSALEIGTVKRRRKVVATDHFQLLLLELILLFPLHLLRVSLHLQFPLESIQTLLLRSSNQLLSHTLSHTLSYPLLLLSLPLHHRLVVLCALQQVVLPFIDLILLLLEIHLILFLHHLQLTLEPLILLLLFH